MTNEWRTLGNPPPESLSDARLQLHHCAQIAAAVGIFLLEPESDDGHTNLGWSDDLGALVSHATADERPFQAAIRVADLTLLLLDSDGRAANRFPLSGTKLHQGYEWLASAIETFTGKPPSNAIAPPPFDLPFHPVAVDETISGEPKEALEELARWFSNADQVLRRVSSERENASDVRCWPHHFDIAATIQIDPHESPEQARSIGLGMTPGDSSYPEPYYYVSPYPAPKDPERPRLSGGGEWHTEGWFGAALPATKLLEGGSGSEQGRRTQRFLESAIEASYKWLGD